MPLMLSSGALGIEATSAGWRGSDGGAAGRFLRNVAKPRRRAADCAARRHTTREINESASASQLR